MKNYSKSSETRNSNIDNCLESFPKSLQRPNGDTNQSEKKYSKNYLKTLKLFERLKSYKNIDCYNSNNGKIQSNISKGKISYSKRNNDLVERMEKDSYRRHFSKISIDLHKTKSEANSPKLSKKNFQNFIQTQMKKEFERNQKIQTCKTENMINARRKEFEILDQTKKKPLSKSRTQKLVNKLYNQSFINKLKLQHKIDRKKQMEESLLQAMFKPVTNRPAIKNELLRKQLKNKKSCSIGNLQYLNINSHIISQNNIPKIIYSTPLKNETYKLINGNEKLENPAKLITTKQKIKGNHMANTGLCNKKKNHPISDSSNATLNRKSSTIQKFTRSSEKSNHSSIKKVALQKVQK